MKATEFLVIMDIKRVAHLAGDLRVKCAQDRVEGYKSALEKNGVALLKDYIKITNFSRKEARFKLEELLQAKDPSFNLDDYEQASLFRYIKEKYGKKSIGIINKLLKLKQ